MIIISAKTYPRQTTNRQHKVHSKKNSTCSYQQSYHFVIYLQTKNTVHRQTKWTLLYTINDTNMFYWLQCHTEIVSLLAVACCQWSSATFNIILGFYIITRMCVSVHYALLFQRYRWSPQRLFLVLCDTDDVDSNRLPTSQLLQRSDQMRGMCKQRLSSCHSLIWLQALWLMRPKHQRRVIILSREALNFFTPCRWGKVGKEDKKGGQTVGFCPQSRQDKFFFFFFPSSIVSGWM